MSAAAVSTNVADYGLEDNERNRYLVERYSKEQSKSNYLFHRNEGGAFTKFEDWMKGQGAGPLGDRDPAKAIADADKLHGAPAKGPDAMAALPDLTDEALVRARKQQLNRMLSGRGRKSSFLAGDLGPEELGRPSLLGG